jgi:hypothetical protein
MMLAAVETVTNADPVWRALRHNAYVAAQATAGESIHGSRLFDMCNSYRRLAARIARLVLDAEIDSRHGISRRENITE